MLPALARCPPVACSIIKISALSGRDLDRALTVAVGARGRFIERKGCACLASSDSERQNSHGMHELRSSNLLSST
jgi:hypothetical protein